MTIIKSSLIVLLGLVLTACSASILRSPLDEHSDAYTPAEQASQLLAEKQPCCESVEQLHFQDIDNDETLHIALTNDSQVYSFPEGKSFVQAYKLTNTAMQIELEVHSLIAKTAFLPQIMLLDANFNVTRVISSEDFVYNKPSMLNGDELITELTIYRPQLDNSANETYLLFYTTEQAMAASTTIEHPAKAFAEAHSTVPPNIADPIIAHSAMGLIKLEIEFQGTKGDAENSYIPKLETQVAVMSELEFNQAIIAAVATDEIDNALSLVEQAEAAGSKSARDTFVNALKKNK